MSITPSSQSRTTDTHALSSSVPSSLSSGSLSSSLSSSRASSDLLPAAPLSSSSQSDIIGSDRSISSLSSSSKPRFFPLALSAAVAPPRSASLVNMGQSQGRPAPPASPPPLSPAPSSASSAGNRLKRAWAGRRKKSEDITGLFSGSERLGKGKEREAGVAAVPPPSAMPDLSELKLERPPSRGIGGPKILNLPNVFGSRKANQQPKLPAKVVHVAAPPPPPPKSSSTGHRTLASSPPHTPAKDSNSPAAAVASVSRQSPSPNPLPQLRRLSADRADTGASMAAEKQGSTQAKDAKETKEDWRKSDSTMASHSTIRPGALAGNRSPRPVSLAESSHSGNTIVPPVNKRLSALIMDAEFTMFEETDGSVSEHETSSRIPASGRPSPTGSLKAKHRRSTSLSIVSSRRSEVSGKPSPPASSQSRNFSEAPLLAPSDTPTLTRTAAAGIISPVTAPGSTQTTGNNIRGRLAAWTAVSATSQPPPTQVERPLPTLPPPQPRRPPGTLSPPPVNPTFRQTAVSMTGSLAPAAGIAMGFGKRAVEKVGRAWGGLTSSASNHSGYSSSSSTGLSDSASGYGSSHHSGPPGRKARRKAPHAFSNASSISSLASSSSEDHHFVSAGPQLGARLRGPRLSSSGLSIAGGLVFKRDLRTCVRESAIDDVLRRLGSGEEMVGFGFRPLENRLLPALVVRCAQHILRWGVQEEGLFRISGRSSHVAKLRSEFDAGADYNLIESEPGDLDPHAVSSIFKTFLRELPEPVLTSALLSYFESALADDQGRRSEDVTQQQPRANPTIGSQLPLRKPPSLSTLAMPSFAGARTISDAQRTAFSWLISRLPQENRDLIYTVVELIKATAARSKETKMPLGNLLLVFCPSLNMSPSLLRALCEAEGIWDGPPDQEAVQQAKRMHGVAVSTSGASHLRSASRNVVHTIDLRLPVVEVDDAPEDMRDSPDDAASFVSALEPSSNILTRTPSPLIYGSTIPPLSSSDSLDSSSVSEELVSPDPPSVKDIGDDKSLASANSLAIPDLSGLSLSVSPRTSNVSVPFPSAGGSVPQSPIVRTPLSHRKSNTLLSFPHLRTDSSPDISCDEQSSPAPLRRVKRPSLHLLFTKKSTSSLPSTITSGNASAIAPSGATNIASRPGQHIASSPPRLDTAISSSPIHVGFDVQANHLRGKDTSTVRSAPSIAVSSAKLDAPALDARSESGGSSVFSTPQSTPIADYFRGRTTSLFLPDTSGELVPPLRARSASQVSDTPSIDIDVAETQQDDWTQSVLLAAQAGRAPSS